MEGEPAQVKAVPPPAAEQEGPGAAGAGWGRAWAIGLGCLAVGALLGALLFAVFVRPLLGGPVQFRTIPGYDPAAPEEALVAVAVSGMVAAPGEWVTVTWLVTNTGKSSWPVDLYYFRPAGAGLPVIPLPESVSPGEEVVVQAYIQVPEQPEGWQPAWRLTGRRGDVPGGALLVRLTITGAV